jgi:hypothetical protein
MMRMGANGRACLTERLVTGEPGLRLLAAPRDRAARWLITSQFERLTVVAVVVLGGPAARPVAGDVAVSALGRRADGASAASGAGRPATGPPSAPPLNCRPIGCPEARHERSLSATAGEGRSG